MDILHLATQHGAYVTLAAVSLLSAVFPLVNAELAVVGLAAGMPSPNLLLLVTVATAAQMVGKSVMYWVGRRASRLGTGSHSGFVARWGHRFQGSGRSVGLLVFLSSASGLPPFYAVSTLAGVFGTNFTAFILAGTAGRFLRFGALGLFPLAIKSIGS